MVCSYSRVWLNSKTSSFPGSSSQDISLSLIVFSNSGHLFFTVRSVCVSNSLFDAVGISFLFSESLSHNVFAHIVEVISSFERSGFEWFKRWIASFSKNSSGFLISNCEVWIGSELVKILVSSFVNESNSWIVISFSFLLHKS